MKLSNCLRRWLIPASLFAITSSHAFEVQVKVDNLSPEGGLYFTPVWVGFHDGSFDLYDNGAAASEALERFAEDGDFSTLMTDFATTGGQDSIIFNPEGFAGAPVFDPGQSSVEIFDLNPQSDRYFSYGAMLLPSNDAFVANGNPIAHPLFDDGGNFIGPISFVVYGSQVLDAGTEANTEMAAAFLNQSAPNTGTSTNDVVASHPGFNGSVGNPAGSPINILGNTVPPGTTIDPTVGDFTRGLVPLMRITVQNNKTPVRVSVKNQAAEGGVYLTPVWLGFHDGSFDLFNGGETASMALERLAEDGDLSQLSASFDMAGVGSSQVLFNPAGFAGAPLFDPGFSSSEMVYVDALSNRYFSYASMVVPSNDAFIGNDHPMANPIFDEQGSFIGPVNVKLYGHHVWDAGTEANTETEAAFFDQMTPDTGDTTTEPVSPHPGFNGSFGNPSGMPQNILGGTNGPGIDFDEVAADFSIPGSPIAEIRLSRAVDGGFSGSWYNPESSGHGLVLDITDDGQHGTRAMVSWYHYNADGSGQQIWLVGVGPVIDGAAIVDLVQTEGALFGEAFNPDDVMTSPWGQVTINFHSCTEATLNYSAADSSYGSGTENLTRLTSGPVDYQGACQL